MGNSVDGNAWYILPRSNSPPDVPARVGVVYFTNPQNHHRRRYQPTLHHRCPQARNAANAVSGIRDALPTHMAFLTDIAPRHYQPVLPSPAALPTRVTTGIIPYYHGMITRSANRVTLITVAYGNLHYGLFTSLPALRAVALAWIVLPVLHQRQRQRYRVTGDR